jgi:hypothetical protein
MLQLLPDSMLISDSCSLALPRASPPARSVCSAFRFRQAGAEGINMETARVMERIHCDGKLQEHP